MSDPAVVDIFVKTTRDTHAVATAGSNMLSQVIGDVQHAGQTDIERTAHTPLAQIANGQWHVKCQLEARENEEGLILEMDECRLAEIRPAL